MKRARRGTLLVEVVVALAVAGGVLLFVIELVQTNVTAVHRLALLANIENALTDLSVQLAARPIADLRRGSNSMLPLDELLQARKAAVPAANATALDEVHALLTGHVAYRLEENPNGLAGLAVIEVTAAFDGGAFVTLTRIFRPGR